MSSSGAGGAVAMEVDDDDDERTPSQAHHTMDEMRDDQDPSFCDTFTSTSNMLYFAAKRNDVASIRQLIASNIPVNERNCHGVTALYISAHYGNVEAVKTLLELGADVTIPKTDGATCMYSACKHGHLDVVKTLVAYGADLSLSKKPNGMSPLHIAAQNGHADVCYFLLRTLNADPTR